jgi:D-amino-acid dehydrogenase
MHYGMQGNATLNRPIIDTDAGFAAGADARRRPAHHRCRVRPPPTPPPTPVQLERAEPVARKLLPLADRVEDKPWLGVRPCMPDMLPVIGPLPKHGSVWCAFGHGHQGLTLGPTTGRLVAEMMTGDKPFVDPAPYRPERF